MDAKSFGNFLVIKLGELSQVVAGNLLNSAYEKIEQSHRAAGARDVLNEIVNKMDNLLADFYAAQDKSAEDSGDK